MCVLFSVEDVRFSKQPIILYFFIIKKLIVVDNAYDHDEAHENVYRTRYICVYYWSGLYFLPSMEMNATKMARENTVWLPSKRNMNTIWNKSISVRYEHQKNQRRLRKVNKKYETWEKIKNSHIKPFITDIRSFL